MAGREQCLGGEPLKTMPASLESLSRTGHTSTQVRPPPPDQNPGLQAGLARLHGPGVVGSEYRVCPYLFSFRVHFVSIAVHGHEGRRQRVTS